MATSTMFCYNLKHQDVEAQISYNLKELEINPGISSAN